MSHVAGGGVGANRDGCGPRVDGINCECWSVRGRRKVQAWISSFGCQTALQTHTKNGWRLASAFGSRDSVGCYQAKEKVTGTFVIFCMINHITSWEHAIPDNPEKMTVTAVEFALAAVDLNVSMGTTIPVGALS